MNDPFEWDAPLPEQTRLKSEKQKDAKRQILRQQRVKERQGATVPLNEPVLPEDHLPDGAREAAAATAADASASGAEEGSHATGITFCEFRATRNHHSHSDATTKISGRRRLAQGGRRQSCRQAQEVLQAQAERCQFTLL